MTKHIVKQLRKLGYGLKANISLKGQNINCCSLALADYISPIDATVVKKLFDKGYFPKMITTMDEFAMGSVGYSEMYGLAEHPKYPGHLVGGSSSGSAIAVYNDEVDFSLGSSTGGSIRLPASFCEILGFEPSYGAVSRFGLVAFGSSLDKIGIFSKNLLTVKKIFKIISGRDPKDMTSYDLKDFALPDKPIKVGYIDIELPFLDKEVAEDYAELRNVQKNIQFIKVDILHLLREANDIYKYIAYPEAYSNLRRYTGLLFNSEEGDFHHRMKKSFQKFGPEVQKRIALGKKYIFEGIYNIALTRRLELLKQFNVIFQEVDFLFLPTTHLKKASINLQYERTFLDFCDLFLSFTNIIHGCAISFPGKKHLSGMQIVGKKGDDYKLLEFLGELYE